MREKQTVFLYEQTRSLNFEALNSREEENQKSNKRKNELKN